METFSRETLDPWFVTGFADGEGSFTYSRSGRQISLYFALKLSAADPLLDLLGIFFGGIGKIYHSTAPSAKAYYRVTRHSELLRIVEHFDAYPLRSSKSNVYQVWREMVLLKNAFRKPDRERLNELASQLSAMRNHTESL